MAKPTIVTRAGKGAALSWTEGDSNLTNLQDATIAIKAGSAGTSVISDLNGEITLVAGTNVTLSGDNTAKTVTINSTASGGMTSFTAAGDSGTSQTVEDGNTLTIAGGTGLSSVASATDVITINLDNTAVTAASYTYASITVDAQGRITSASNGATPLTSGGALGTPSSGTVTNLTGTASININGTVGATTPGLGTFTGATIKGGTGINRARLLLDNTSHQSTAWTTTGIGIVVTDNTIYRDTSSTGTVADVYIHTLGSANLERTNTGTFTTATTLYVAAPSAGFQTTLTNTQAAYFNGKVRMAGNLTVDGGATISGALNGTVGATTASTGAFTTLSASTSVSFSPSGAITLNPTTAGTINNMSIGATTASTGAFTTLGASGAVTLSPANAAVAISPSGTGTVAISPAGALTINPTTASTINNTSIGVTTAAAGRFTTLTHTGAATLKDIRETVATVTYAATITPDAANGSIQTITLTGNVTFSAFSNPVSGQSITLIITQDATGSRTLTSTMKFSGASKTLSTAANSIDILTVSYIGTTYYASLAKGFA
jgi:hypothetical protein